MNDSESDSDYFLTPLTILPGEEEIVTFPKPHIESIQDSPAVYKKKKLPLFTNLYIGSLTVIGLFIVFRLIQKSR